MYGITVMSDMGANLKQKGYSELRYVISSVYRYVHYRNSFFFCIIVINYVVTSCQNCDTFQIRAFVDGLFADRSFVDNSDISITKSLSDKRRLLICGSVIYSNLSKFLKRCPADVTRVLGVTV